MDQHRSAPLWVPQYLNCFTTSICKESSLVKSQLLVLPPYRSKRRSQAGRVAIGVRSGRNHRPREATIPGDVLGLQLPCIVWRQPNASRPLRDCEFTIADIDDSQVFGFFKPLLCGSSPIRSEQVSVFTLYWCSVQIYWPRPSGWSLDLNNSDLYRYLRGARFFRL